MTRLVLSSLRKLTQRANNTDTRVSRKKQLQRAIRLESLESRHLMAGVVAGTVFDDLNANGADDPGENGLAGWTVFIDSNGSGTLNPGELSTVTDNKGKYSIANVPAGVREVYEVPQPGWRPSPGFTDHRTITVQENKETRVKFGNVNAPLETGNITGEVWNDVNENLISDSGEDALVGWTIFLDANNDGALNAGEASTTTDAGGMYLFTNIPAGSRTVVEIPRAGLQPTAGGLFPAVGASVSRTVSVVNGATATADFPNALRQIGNVSGNVYQDANGDGIKAATDAPVAGVTVYVDVNNSLTLDAGEPVRTTDATGAYNFTGLRAGTYRINEVLPAGNVGAVAAPSSQVISVFGGSSISLNFFNVVPTVGTISGKVYDDADANGLQGVEEAGIAGRQVFIDRNNNAVADAGEPSATTAADGSYTFSGVPYGLVTVRNVLPAAWLATNPTTSASQFVLLNGQNRTGVDFATRENIGLIRGTVWNDDNGDGVRQPTEAFIPGVTVYIDMNGDSVQSPGEPAAVSGADGVYALTRIVGGTYTINEVVPAGMVTSVGKATSVTVSVLAGSINTLDFFNLVPRLGSISGTVFGDLNSNGVQDVSERGLPGFQVYADVNNNNAFDAVDILAITDAAGNYTLVDVPYGSVNIHEVLLTNYDSTSFPGGVASIVLLNGEVRTGLNFGTKEPVDFVLSGMAFFDANHDGVRQADERGLSGVKVYLDANNNGSLDTGEQWTITSVDQFYTPAVNELGTYAFTHLARGDYVLREIVPSEQDATAAAARVINVTVGPSKTDANFANIFRPNEIRGVVFDDTDLDHSYDVGEHTRSGVEIYIDSNRNNIYEAGEPLTVTGADGSYAFTSLTPGAYIVRELGDHGDRTYPNTGGGILWPAGISNPAIGNVTPTLIQQSLTEGQSYRQTVSLTLPNGGGVSNLVDVFLLFDDTGSFTANSPIVRAAFPDIISRLQASLPGVDLGFGVGRLEEYGNFAAEFATGRPFILNQPIVASSTTGFSTAIQSALDRMAPGYGGDLSETDIEALFQVVTGRGFDGNNNGTVLDSGPAGLAGTQLVPGNSGDVPSFDSFIPDPANGVLPAAGNVGGAGFRPGALPIILTATDTGFAYQPKNETSIVGAGGLTLPLSALTQSSRASTPFGAGAGIQETITGLNALGALVVGLGTNAEANLAPRSSLEALAKLTGAVNQSTTTIANGTGDAIAPGDPLYFQISTGFGATVADGITNAIQNAVTTVALDITIRASDPRVHIINHTGTILGVNGGQTASFDVEFIGDSRPHRFDLQFVRAGTSVVIGSIPVVLGTPVDGDHYGYDELEDGEIHHSSHFGNYVANVAPTFVGGTDVSVQEDAGTQSVAAWATSMNPGASWETGQALNFIVTNSNPALFSTQPSIAANGTLNFTPAANAFGTATVTVQLHDNGGVGSSGADTSAPQTFVISVASVSDAPTTAADNYILTSGATLAVPAVSGVLANDIDVDGDAITAQLVDMPLHGTVTLQADGSFTYVSTAGYAGTDTFTYRASDGALTSTLTTVTFTVNRANVAPVATGGSYTTNEDTPLNVAAPGVLEGDTDGDADPLTAVLVGGTAHGTVVLNADGSFVYTPSANYAGPDSFTYSANDGVVNSDVATINLTVVATNRAPVAAGDTFAATEDTPLTVAAPGVLAGDSDADGDPLTAAVLVGPAHGVLLLNANGSFTYTPTANFNGTDSFSYKVNDGQVDSNVATVTINIAAVNDAPVALADTFAATEDATLTVAAPGVLSNDTDAEGATLVPTLVRNALHGTVTLAASGSFQYVPVANYNGLDSFTYSVSDGSLSSAVVTVTLNVANVNDAPVAVGNTYSATEDVVLSIAAPGVLAGDSDLDGNVLRALLVTAPTKGTVTLSTTGSFVYTPSANVNGVDTFTYKANDGTVDSNTVTVTINVAAVNDVPVSGADSYSVNQNAVLNVAAPGVLGNDSDGDGDVLTAAVVTGPAHGTLTLNANGSLSYTPTTGYNGPDSFTYQASDGTNSSAATTVSITVLPPPPPSTKFFVVDQDRTTTYQYGADGTPITNNALNKSDSKPRGIASNSTGTTLWVIDGGGTVFVYDKNGTLLGSWQPQGVGKPEGITVWGNDLWLVDPVGDRVYFFSGGAAVRTGRVNPTSNFALNSGNLNSTDLVTDGVKIWVVNDTTTADKVFRYTKAGALEGSWTISTTNTNPTGMTLDPTSVNHLWIVDAISDRVYQYDNGTARLTGAQEPSVTFALAATNTNAQGIADPLTTSVSTSAVSVVAAPAVSSAAGASSSSAVAESKSTQSQLVDTSLQQLVDGDDDQAATTASPAAAVLACGPWIDQLAAEQDKRQPAESIDQLMAEWF